MVCTGCLLLGFAGQQTRVLEGMKEFTLDLLVKCGKPCLVLTRQDDYCRMREDLGIFSISCNIL